jgi:hypothetical protein
MIRSRRAVSMIELLIVMSACTVVLTLSSSLIVRAMRAHTQSRAYSASERNALRLSSQFRRDVHAAQSAVASGNAQRGDPFLRMELTEDQQVEYSLFDGTVLRLMSRDGKRTAREAYAFPAGCQLIIRELELPRRIALTIATRPNFDVVSEGSPRPIAVGAPLSLHVEANLGHDWRLAPALDQGQEDGP